MALEIPQSIPKVLWPEMPKNAGKLDVCTELSLGEDYLIDRRVVQGRIACGWKAKGVDVDVDVSLAAYDYKKKCVDVIWWDKKSSQYASCMHHHDDRQGAPLNGTDINEHISIAFKEVPSHVHYFLVVLTVYSKKKTLEDVSDMFLKLVYDDQDLMKFEVPDFESSAALIGVFGRSGSWWSFKGLAEQAKGRTVKEVVYNKPFCQIIADAPTALRFMRVSVGNVEAHDLAAVNPILPGNSVSNCFVEIKFNQHRWVSKLVGKSSNVKWEMPDFEFGTTNETDDSIVQFNVWDHDVVRPDIVLGCALVTLGYVCQRGVGRHSVRIDLGPYSDPEFKMESSMKVSGYINVDFEVAEVDI